jgi:hypothetical protein
MVIFADICWAVAKERRGNQMFNSFALMSNLLSKYCNLNKICPVPKILHNGGRKSAGIVKKSAKKEKKTTALEDNRCH